MVSYREAFRLPFTNWKRAGLLFVISALANLGSLKQIKYPSQIDASFLILILIGVFFSFFLMGYVVRIAGSASNGRNELPGFGGAWSLLVRGLKYFAAMIVYALPAGLLLVPFALSRQPAAGFLWLVLLIPVMILWMFFFAYVFPLLAVHFAHENRFAAFFELGKVIKYAFTGRYFVPWLVALAYSFAILVPFFIVITVLAVISFYIPVFSVFTIFASGAVTVIVTPAVTNIYGQAYREITAGTAGASRRKK